MNFGVFLEELLQIVLSVNLTIFEVVITECQN